METNKMSMDEIIARINQISKDMASNAKGLDYKALTEETEALLARKKELETEANAMEMQRKALEVKLNSGLVETKTVTPKVDDDDMIARKAFMNYVINGVDSNMLTRADSRGTSQNLGIMIPNHVQQEIIKELDKIYGTLYSKVKKLNLQGGVQYPIGSFEATFTRIAEGAKSDRQNAGGITGNVTFGYFIGEIRISRTLLQMVLSVPAFEREIAKVIAEAYVKAMDLEIMKGEASKMQCEGILKNTNVNTIELTEADMADWKALQKEIFAKFPLAYRGKNYEFVMTANTWESNIMTLTDNQNRPVYTETNHPVTGITTCKLRGHEVQLVEPDILADFDTAEAGDVFGMIWIPKECYAINSNLNFTVRQYFDEETNDQVTKALVVNDGKVLRPHLIYLLKKKATKATPAQGSQGSQGSQG